MSKNKNNGGAKEASGGKQERGKEEGGKVTVVLKVSIHCEGCAAEVTKAAKGFTGVETAKADVERNEVRVVVGKDVDPWKLRDRVAAKTHKKVDLVSPTEKPQVKKAKPGDKKSLTAETVVLKISLHCDGCISKIHKTIWRIKGVEHVAVHAEKDEVTVKGTMDAKELPAILKEKLNRAVEVVQPKKDDGTADGGNKKKNTGAAAATAAVAENSRMDSYTAYGYRFVMMPHYAPEPQMFSDENPNACSIM